MNANTTPPQLEKHCYKVPFSVKGNLAMIYELRKMGVIIRLDQNYQHACACFDNTIDYNNFKDKLAALSIV